MRHGDGQMILSPKSSENANGAILSFGSSELVLRNFALTHVACVRAMQQTGPVYNLTVEGEGEYFANGVLVHNCDVLAWGVAMQKTSGPKFGPVPDVPIPEARRLEDRRFEQRAGERGHTNRGLYGRNQ